jgi:hypothetical protein
MFPSETELDLGFELCFQTIKDRQYQTLRGSYVFPPRQKKILFEQE